MTEQEPVLLQNAYPSASASERSALTGSVPETDNAEVSAFGIEATLPVAGSSRQPTGAEALPLPNPLSKTVAEPLPQADAFSPMPPESESTPLTTAIPLPAAEPVATGGGMRQAAYPSVSPHQGHSSAGAYEPASRTRPRPGVRNSIKSFMSANQALTVPIRGIARVAQRQFTMAATLNQERFVREQEEAREVLNFTVRLAESMFHYGADTMDVDGAIVAVCSTYGLDDVEVSVTNQSILINYVSDIEVSEENKQLFSSFGARTSQRFSHTVVRVVRSNSENYSSLDAIYKLIHAITEKGLSRGDAEKRLQEINTCKKLYSPAMILLFNLLMAVSFTFGVGGGWQAATVAFAVFIAVHFSMGWVGRLKLPSFFSMVVGSGVITAAALYVSRESPAVGDFGFSVSGPHVVAAGLMMLLPTFRLVSASQDALTGFPLTAAGKFVTTGMNFIGLVVGIALALSVMSYFDAATIDVQQAVFNTPPLWVSVLGMAMGSVMVAAAAQGTWQNMLWVLSVSFLGQGIYYGMTLLTSSEPGKLNVALGAFTVGAVSTMLAFRLHSPQSIYAVPGVMFLLPGLTIFRGLYSLVIDPSPIAGITSLLDASASILSLSAGVILGIFIAQNIIQQVMDHRSKA